MPLNIMIGILCVLAALVLYSMGVWGAFRAIRMELRHLRFLWLGFVFDVLATTMMVLQAGGLQNDLHSILALGAMAGMLVCAAAGTWAYSAGKDSVRAAVTRWVVASWIVWVFVFVWGMISRGAARLIR